MRAADARGHAAEGGGVVATIAGHLLPQMAHLVRHRRQERRGVAILGLADTDHRYAILHPEIGKHIGVANHREAQLVGMGQLPALEGFGSAQEFIGARQHVGRQAEAHDRDLENKCRR